MGLGMGGRCSFGLEVHTNEGFPHALSAFTRNRRGVCYIIGRFLEEFLNHNNGVSIVPGKRTKPSLRCEIPGCSVMDGR